MTEPTGPEREDDVRPTEHGPAGEATPPEFLAELADEFVRRFRDGERPSVEAYAAAHPALAGQIRDLFPALLTIEQSGADAPGPAERVGAVVGGRYKLLERLGEGGWGVVYMAEQLRPVRRKVALKVIKPGLDSRQVIARFEAERQALALMDHENIARVLDAGATDSGRPYFVMELVRGVPITRYCDEHRLAPRERLALFVQVCRAVQHAHTKGIIHRDLKPTNVLVASHDGAAVPKVIDFGVAKATGRQLLTERTLFTQFAQMVGTPLYMSPEQAELSGLDVDTRSDVYSLGVLLYELLTGTTPFDKQRLAKAAYDEVRRIIREEEPPRPSTRLGTLGEALAAVSERRHIDPRKLSTILRGELDWIVMRALEKDRSRRYETANGFARDIERYLTDEPVEACPPSKAYRLRKLARRYRGPLRIAAAFGLLLLAATVVSTWQAVRASHEAVRATRAEAVADKQRNEALGAKARADEEAAISEGLVRFFCVEVIGQANPVQVVHLGLRYDPKITVRDALDRAANRIGKWAKSNPMLEAAVRGKVAIVYDQLGDAAKAIEQGERSLAIRRRYRGVENPGTLGCMNNLATTYVAAGDYEKAEALFLEALPVAHRLLGDDNWTTLILHQDLADAYCKMGRYAEAEEQISHTYRKGVTTPHVYQIEILAEICFHKEEYDKAEAMLLKAIWPPGKAADTEDNIHGLWLKQYLAKTYDLQGDFEETESLFLSVLAGYRKLFDGDESTYSYDVMSCLAEFYDAWGEHEQATTWRAKLPTNASPASRPGSPTTTHAR